MESRKKQTYQYQVGGSLKINAPSYVERQADQDLYQALIAGQFCYVFNARQMGKSSLRVRVKHRLHQAKCRCASIDVTSIGSERTSPEQWYMGIAYGLFHSFKLQEHLNFIHWWQLLSGLSPVQKLSRFIEDILLTHVTGEMIFIFIDEIDSILSLDFSMDDFFALIRACYNKRADNPAYNRLTFALFGVAAPSDLMQDRHRTPFNTGQAIDLHGFQLTESKSLIQGLVGTCKHPEKVLEEILAWTGGQPFLTQKLCCLAIRQQREVSEECEEVKRQACRSLSGSLDAQESIQDWIESLVRSHLIQNWQSQDNPEHLRTIRDRLLRNESRVARLLGFYQQILQAGSLPAQDNDTQAELLLSGLIIKRKGQLSVSNRIYGTVFNRTWVQQQLEYLRPYSEGLNAWFASGAQDDSRLLRGQALQDAQAWAKGKSLTNQDYQFLTASQALDQQFVRDRLATESSHHQAQKRRGDALSLIMEGTAAQIGNDFFISCVRCLAEILNVQYALIAVFANEAQTRGQTLAFWGDEELAESWEYDLSGTPCEQVLLTREPCHYPSGLQSMFPQDPHLVRLQAQSYLGMPILDYQGEVLGHLAVMDTKPFNDPIPDPLLILRIFAARAGAELKRKQAEETLEQQLQQALLLKRITQDIRHSLDTTQILQTTASQVGKNFQANRCLIYTYIPYPIPTISWAAEYCEFAYPKIMELDIAVVDDPYTHKVLSEDIAIASPNVYTDLLLKPMASMSDQVGLKSMIAIRTSYHHEPNGIIVLQQCDRFRDWTTSEIELLEAVASQVGIALAQAQLLEQEQQQRSQLDHQNQQLQQEIMDRQWIQSMLDSQNKVLNLIATGTPLKATLNALAQIIETLSGQSLCSVLLLDNDTGQLLHGAAPSLPMAYNQAIHGLRIGPMVGSCGTAAYFKKTVIIADIATDPRWTQFQGLVLEHGLRACWSTPVLSEDTVVATFAMYYREPRSPNAKEIELVEKASDLVRVALEHQRVLDALHDNENRYRQLRQNS